MVQDFTRNRDLYARVGADYSWIDRLGWSDRQWRAWAERVETHMVELRGRPIGYFELEPEPSSTKIAIFGLLGGFHGRGLGGHALTPPCAAASSWARGSGSPPARSTPPQRSRTTVRAASRCSGSRSGRGLRGLGPRLSRRRGRAYDALQRLR